MQLKEGKNISFNNKKDFKYIKPLGKGGTGDIHLFLDETTDMKFAIKKYLPYNETHRKDFYNRFVNEIKILFQLSHPNIVRIYNYYLYPNSYMGYLQMEYIEGITINKYKPNFFNKQWDEIFMEIISAFHYLELKKILHRDIRFENIMITNTNNVKIIDFGFGKTLQEITTNKNSVFLNWPVTEYPEEISKGESYTVQTEIFFLGKLFSSLLASNNDLENFKYKFILEKMCKISINDRYVSFTQIKDEISKGFFVALDFSNNQQNIYQAFANNLEDKIISFSDSLTTINTPEEILSGLTTLISNNSLEEYIQNNNQLISIFIDIPYTYNSSTTIPVNIIKDFYSFFYKLPSEKQKIVLNNLFTRLSKIEVEPVNDFPF